MPVYFEWDESKNRTNIVKHGISFDTAKLVFEDPHVISFPDETLKAKNAGKASAAQIVL